MDNGLENMIINEALSKANSIIESSNKQIENLKTVSKARIEKIMLDLEKNFQIEKQYLLNKAQTNKRSVDRKLFLKKREIIEAQIDSEFKRELKILVGNEKFTKVLEDWSVSAIIALQKDNVILSSNPHLKKDSLDRISIEVKKQMGIQINIKYDERNLVDYGVVCTSLDKTVSYSNLVRDRMRRFKNMMSSIIEDALKKREV